MEGFFCNRGSLKIPVAQRPARFGTVQPKNHAVAQETRYRVRKEKWMVTACSPYELEGRRALVTGAANGIGAACAKALAAQGCRVACADVYSSAGTVAEISRAGGEAINLTGDISIEHDVLKIFGQVQSRFLGLDFLVHCAGIVMEKPLLTTKSSDFDRIIAVNLRGSFLVGREAVRMMQRNGGRVILIASDLAYLGRERHSPYVASKHGVLGLVRSWAIEFGPDILVNAICPGPTDTAMLSPETLSSEMLKKELQIPLERLGRPEEIAAMAVFLVSGAAGYMTGQGIGVNGGSVMP